MYSVTVFASNPIVENLLKLMLTQLPKPNEDFVLLDASLMERMSEFSGKRIILFTSSSDPAYLSAAKAAGADGFWYLESSLYSLNQVLSRQFPFPEQAPVVQIGNAWSNELTKRELDVLRQLVNGKSDADIAETLGCSLSTVKHYISTLREKTGISSRVSLAVLAVAVGLINSVNG